jgi:hypothetical protein
MSTLCWNSPRLRNANAYSGSRVFTAPYPDELKLRNLL